MDQILFSSRVWMDGKFSPVYIKVSDGKIVQLSDSPLDSIDCIVHNFEDNIIMPALCDPHVHINEPGRTEWEGFETATAAAAAGGIGTIIDMPLNSSPVSTTVENLKLKKAASVGKLRVNVGFYGGIVPGNQDEILGLAAEGIRGYKAFLTHSGIDEFPNVTMEDLKIAMPLIAQTGLPLLVHCELDSHHDDIQPFELNPFSYSHYLASRPKSWEDEAIKLMIDLCRSTGCRVHIVHLSSANMLKEIEEARKSLPLTVESAPHYLYFSAEQIQDNSPEYKCAPPIREKANNKLLWEALMNGVIDFIGTDHSPAPPDIKSLDTGNYKTAWGGISCIQFFLPIVWTKARALNIPLEKVLPWICENAYNFLGLFTTKGKIEVGYDADFVVWNPHKSQTIQESNIHFRHKITPYMGQELFGVVLSTCVAGEWVYFNQTLKNNHVGKIV